MVYVVKLSIDGKFLAIGDYNSKVTVVDLEEKKLLFELGKDEGLTFFIWGLDFIVIEEHKKPRYRLAVGCWNNYAFVFDFDLETRTPKLVAKVKRQDRVFDVCLSADGSYLLVGGRDGAAALYQVNSQLDEHPHNEPLFEAQDGERVYCVALNPKATRLAFGGIMKTVKVYEHKNEHPWGLIRTYKHGHTVHRMEFLDKEMLAAISEDGKCVIYKVTSQAPILQLTYNDAGNSLALSKFGMLAVAHGHHAMFSSFFAGIDVELDDDGGRRMTPFEMLGKSFPDLLLRFLSKLKLMPCEDQVLGDEKYMTLHEPLYVGLSCKSPQSFWQKYYKEYKGTDDGFKQTNTPFLVQAYRMPIPGLCGDPQVAGKKSKKGICCNKKVGQEALIHSPQSTYATAAMDAKATGILAASSPDVLALYHEKEQQTCLSPLAIIVDAARSQQDFNVFKSHTVVYALVKYKWRVLQNLFFFQYMLFLVYLVLCAMLSMTLSNYAGASMSDLFSVAWYAFPLSILLGLRSIFYLHKEWLQLKYEYQMLVHPDHRHKSLRETFDVLTMLKAVYAYISDDFWNLLDVSSFFTQLLTDICVWTRWSGTLGFASVSILLLFGKIFFFARGFEQWGPFVRMIQRTMQDMKSFLLVMLVFFLGFALALDVMLGGNDGFSDLYDSFFTVTLIVYGQFDSILDLEDGWSLATLLFETFLLVVVIILLNLLVAIMSESFADVQENAANETLYELASIIVELEKVDQGAIGQDKSNALFPKWVHVLKPVNEDFEDEAVDSNERMDSIEKAIGQMDGKMDTLASSLNELKAELRQYHKAEVDHD